ncbi:MAG TPA: hypothetical protein VFX20_21610 [Steroidobacteraceae bacterium]|nr:hypothetical protein [Steroidobacteraceae bacterium]
MSAHTNDFATLASNGTRKATVTYLRTAGTSNRGEVIMNRIQKATAAAVALTITLVGAVCVTAPLALADVHPVAVHQVVSATSADHNSSYSVRMTSLRHG